MFFLRNFNKKSSFIIRIVFFFIILTLISLGNAFAQTATKIDLTGPDSMEAGTISTVFTLTSQDDLSNPTNVTEDTVFSLYSDSGGVVNFYEDPEGTMPIAQVTISSGSNTVTFYYSDTLQGLHSVTAQQTSGMDLGSANHQLTVGAAAAVKLVFSQQPTDAGAGVVITPAVTVEILDAYDNLVSGATNEVNVAIGENPGLGTLSGIKTQNAVNGIATFGNLSIDKAGTGYTLTASSTGLSGDTSSAFSITAGAVSYIVISPETSTITSGSTQTYTAVAFDEFDNSLGEVTSGCEFSIATGAGGSWSANEYTSENVGTWEVTATHTDSGAEDTATLTVGAGEAVKLVFSQQPTDAGAGVVITPAVTVEILDAYDNLVTGATNEVTISLESNPGGGTLSGTKTKAASGGIATFDNLSIDKEGTGYTLTASSTGLSSDTSSAFSITAGAVSYIVVSPETSTITSGSTQTYTAEAFDEFDNNLGEVTSGCEFSIATGAGGSWSANEYTSENVGTWEVTATHTDSGAEDTATLTVGAGEAVKLAFSQQPTDAGAGVVITPAVTVEILDAYDNLVTGATNEITIGFGNNAGGGTLSGTKTKLASGGIATFDNLSIDKEGTGYTLTASSTGLSGDTSSAFSITAGAVSYIVVSPETSTITSGSTQTYTAVAFDEFDNNLGEVTSGCEFSIATGAGGSWSANVYTSENVGTWEVTATHTDSGAEDTATLTVEAGALASFTVDAPATSTAGTAFSVTVTAKDTHGNNTTNVSGATGLSVDEGAVTPTSIAEAEFTDNGVWTGNVTLTKAGERTITAENTGKTGSDTININPGAATNLAFSQQPTDAEAGVVIAPAVTVEILDANDNLVTGATNEITIGFGNNAGGGTLSGTLARDAVSGVATFNDLSIDKKSTGYTLDATSPGLSSATSVSFNITVGTADKIRIEDQPDGSGVEVDTRSIATGESFTVYAISRDVGDNFVDNVSVTWSLIEQSGGLANSDLVPSGDGKSAVFTGHAAGSVKIKASHATWGDDTTGIITVTVDGDINILLQPSDVATSGNNIELLVEISNNNNSINSFGLDFVYDDALFTFKGVEKGTLTSDWALNSNPDPVNSGRIYIDGMAGTSIFPLSSGSLFKIKLQVNCMDYSVDTQSQLKIENYIYDLERFYPDPAIVEFTFKPCGRLGDVNGSGSVTPGDAQSAFEIFLGIISPDFCQESTSDANCNEYTTPGDAQDIFEHFLGIKTLPECCAEYTVSSMLKFYEPIKNRDRGRERDRIMFLKRKLYPLHTMGYPGEIVRIPIIIANPEGITSFAFEMNYPSVLLEFVGKDRTRLTQHFEYINGVEMSDGLIRVEGESEIPIRIRNLGSLVVLIFRVMEGPEASTPLLIFNLEGDLINAETSEGNFHRLKLFSEEPRYVNLGKTVHMPDGTVRVPIRVSSAFNVKSFGFKLEYAADKMTFIGVEKGHLTEDFMTVKGNEIEFGKVMIGAYSLSRIQEKRQGILLELVFSIGEGGDVKVVKTFDDIENFIIQRGKIRVE